MPAETPDDIMTGVYKYPIRYEHSPDLFQRFQVIPDRMNLIHTIMGKQRLAERLILERQVAYIGVMELDAGAPDAGGFQQRRRKIGAHNLETIFHKPVSSAPGAAADVEQGTVMIEKLGE